MATADWRLPTGYWRLAPDSHNVDFVCKKYPPARIISAKFRLKDRFWFWYEIVKMGYKSSKGMKVVGVLLLLTGLTVTMLLRFSPAMGRASAPGIEINTSVKLMEQVAPVQWAPAIGSVLIVAGSAIVIAGRRRRKTVARQMPGKLPVRKHEHNDRKIKELEMNNATRIFYARKNSVH